MKTDRDNNGENFESTDEIDEENKGEIEEIETEVGAEIQIIRPHAPIDGDKNGENFESTDDIDEENKGQIEEIETAKELEETNIKDKQKIKELEAGQNTIEDGKLVHKKKDKELINSKMIAEKNEFINTILTTENSLTDKIEIEGENPERDKKINGEQDKIHKITKESLLDNNSAKLQFEWTRLRETTNFHNAIVKRDNKQERRFKSSNKVYIRQKRSVMAFYVPRSTVYVHCNTWKLLEVKNNYHKGNGIIKFGYLEIWKLLGVKNNYYKGNEIIKFGNEAIKYKNKNIDETKIHKYWTNKKLGIEFKSGKQASCADTYLTKGKTKQGNRNWCEENKLKKLIVLNYTKRGKQQELQLKLFIL